MDYICCSDFHLGWNLGDRQEFISNPGLCDTASKVEGRKCNYKIVSWLRGIRFVLVVFILFFWPLLHPAGCWFFLDDHKTSGRAWTTAAPPAGRRHFHCFLGVKCTSTILSHPTPLSPPPPTPPRPPLCSPHQFIKPVTWLSLQSKSERAPWQRTRGKSTGIKFQRNCLLNCGPQLLKFHPRFRVTVAVMNSVWL